MLCGLHTADGHHIVVEGATGRLRHTIDPSGETRFLAWLGGDGRRALGFAADLRPIVTAEGADGEVFVTLTLARRDQGLVVALPGQTSSVVAEPGGAIASAEGWPTLWRAAPVGRADTPAVLAPALDLLQGVTLDGAPDDLIRVSRGAPDPALTPLTRALVALCPPGAIGPAVPEVAAGPGYPAMFEVLRAHFLASATRARAFAPFVDWGGSPDCVSAGAHTYGCPRIMPYGHAKVVFGRYCSIAEAVNIILGNHAMNGSSTYPFKDESPRWPSQVASTTPDWTARDVVVGNDVWIGFLSTILSGAQIGDGAIIGAGSVVRGIVPPYTIAVGNPAKVVRERYPPDITARFLKLRWWDWPDWKVDRHSGRMFSASPAEFLDAAEADRG